MEKRVITDPDTGEQKIIEVMDIREQCRERATKFAKEWNCENVSDHILDIMVSIMCTRDKSSYAGGSFVQAICDNNLRQCVDRADSDCINHLKLLSLTHSFCHVESNGL